MAIRTLDEIVEIERITEPTAEPQDIMFWRMQEMMTCRLCGTLGVVTKKHHGIPTLKQTQGFRNDYMRTLDYGTALREHGLTMCKCRKDATEMLLAVRTAASEQLILPPKRR